MNKLKEQAQDKAFEARRMIRKADDEHRELVEEERQKIEKLLDEADKLRQDAETQEEAVKVFGGEKTLTHGGDPNAVIGQGWEALGKSIDLKAGKTKAAVPLDGLMRGKAGTFPDSEDFPPLRGPSVVTPVDTRYLYPNLARAALGPELSVAEFRQVGSAEVASGNVLRYPTDVTTKAEVDVELELVQEKVRQVAATISNVPNAILEAEITLRAFLQVQLRVKLDQAIDAHCVAAIDAASFHGGAVGADLISQIRNGIAAMNSLGTNPTIVALSPTDSVELDLFTTGADDAYAFALRDSGSSVTAVRPACGRDARGDQSAADRPAGVGCVIRRTGKVRG